MTVRFAVGDIAFEWDERKAVANRRKHGVTFEEAATAFLDPDARVFDDPDIQATRLASCSSASPRADVSCWWSTSNAGTHSASSARGWLTPVNVRRWGSAMREHYDLRAGRPNPYAKRITEAGRDELVRRFHDAERLVRLDDDVAAVFTTEESVNEALRLLLRVREITPKPGPARATKRAPAKRRATSK